MTLEGKHIVLGICGGIAAYKSASLLRLLVKRGAEVQVVMTPAGREFITPVTLSTLSGKPVITEFFTANTGQWNSHVDLGLWADLMLIAPATASSIAKMANGVADNMLITTYLSAKAPVMIAPSMDLDMFAHPTTTRNLEQLRADGVEIIEPASGELASHLIGKGRMAEPEEIVERVETFFNRRKDMAGLKVGITAGPTYERLDPVRYIGNFSSGKMGFALARECAARGAEVTLICGPVANKPRLDAKVTDVMSALEMQQAAQNIFPDCDVMIFAAAVADYRPEQMADNKIKREGVDCIDLRLVRNPDIAATICGEKRPEQTCVGFALETDNGHQHAVDKMQRKGLDMIVLNSLSDKGAGFGTDTNKVTIISTAAEHAYELKSKDMVAADIVNEIMSLRAIEQIADGNK